MMLLLLFPRCCLFTGHVRVTVVTRHGVVSRLGRHGVCGPRAVWRSGVAVLILQMKFCVLLLKKKRHFFFLCSKKASCDFGNSVRQFFMTPAQSCCRAKSLTRASHRLPAAAFSFNNFNHLLSDPSIQKLTSLVCMKTDNCFSL